VSLVQAAPLCGQGGGSRGATGLLRGISGIDERVGSLLPLRVRRHGLQVAMGTLVFFRIVKTTGILMQPKSLRFALVATLLCARAAAGSPDVRPEIEVAGTPLSDPAILVIDPAESVTGISADTGEWLRSLPGVAGSRLGGHGIDPVIRGQSDTRLNILLDGAYVHGGCPNRMDPPTSYAPLASYDRVTVLRGSQTVRYGGGGSGGTVLLERYTERFTGGESYRADASAGYGSNGERRDYYADVASGNEAGFVRALAGHAKSNSYEDGNNDKVRSAYEEKGGALMFGMTPDADTRVEASIESIRGDDFLYAGRMDAPKSDDDVYRLKLSRQGMQGFISQVEAELYHSDVDHVMDNFSLRPLPAMMMKMKVPSSSNTSGGRISIDHLTAGGSLWTVGVDVQNNSREAIRYAGPALDTVNSLLWPQVDTDQAGLFVEAGFELSPRRRLNAGIRYDRVEASAGDAEETLSGMLLGPDQLYTLYYAATADDVTENNVGGFVRVEQDLRSAPVTLFAGFSRSVRTADATERFIAANNPMDPTLRWVGNPRLDPERHHQLELGLNAAPGAWTVRTSLYLDEVSDYILRDTARGQDGIAQSDLATIYRNIDARFYGGELELARNWGAHWSSRFSLARVYGRNTDDNAALAQIPAHQYSAALDYRRAGWMLGGRLHGAARQDRVDSNPASGSGLDAGETGGWTVLDVYAEVQVGNALTLRAGVDNLFDKAYADHINRANAFDPVQVQVNEPGRSLWLKAEASF
jgi:iron complex outermembrane receptor protein